MTATYNKKFVKVLDNLTLAFIVIFLASLTNSIFLNQLGYYGALILVLTRFFITRDNRFFKTGLEIFLLLFVFAEIISTIFSVNQPQAFQNLLKRILLLPIIYTTIAAASDISKAKLFFKVYISFASLSALIYLINSYQYFVDGLFYITGSGPSVFQYPITTSELLSFTVIFLFVFLINEKTSWKLKLVTFTMFAISLLALIATYKRTGWLGVAAGLVIVLIVRKKYLYLIPFGLVLAYLVLTANNESKVFIYEFEDDNYTEKINYDTPGRAFSVLAQNGKYHLSDYENGLVTYVDAQVENKLETIEPIVDLMHWKDDFYCAALIDTRFLIQKKKNEENFKVVNEFLTPGFTRHFNVSNNFLYVLDSDSGLTVFKDPQNLEDKLRFKEINNFVWFDVDSNSLALFSRDKQVSAFSLKSLLPSDGIEIKLQANGRINFIKLINRKLFFSDEEGLKSYDFVSRQTKTLESTINETIVKMIVGENKIFALTSSRNLFDVDPNISDSVKVLAKLKLGFIPKSVTYHNNKIYATKVKRSRLASIFDPYLPSNVVRIALWKAGWKIFKDYPFLGVGDIDLAELYKKYKSDYDKEIQGHLHNNYVHLLVILGGFGFVVVMLLLGAIAFYQLKIYNKLKNIPFSSSFSLGVIGCFVSFLVSGLSEWNFGDHEIITMIWFIVGLNNSFYFNSINNQQTNH